MDTHNKNAEKQLQKSVLGIQRNLIELNQGQSNVSRKEQQWNVTIM